MPNGNSPYTWVLILLLAIAIAVWIPVFAGPNAL